MATAQPGITPVPWTNQPLTLYHGTMQRHVASILAGITLSSGRAYTDFGQGFYTTTVEQQARAWAWTLSQRARGYGNLPAVVRFDVDRDSLAQLDCVWFVRGSLNADDFWSLVFHCRTGQAAHRRAGPGELV
jgi:hypothetical protein